MADNVPSASHGSRSGVRPAAYSPPCSPGVHRSEYNSSSSGPFPTSIPLAIRGAPMDIAPPPLPPPRHLPVLAGSKPLWHPHGQPHHVSGSVAPGSSLMGNWRPSPPPSVTRKPGIPILHSPLREGESCIKAEDESLPSIASFQARPLDTHNQQKSTEAYDKHQLSKLGRPKTPVRSSAQRSIDNSPIATGRLRLDTQNSLHRLTLADRSVGSDSPFKESPPLGRWSQHQSSGALSPGMMSSAASSRSLGLSDLRSPVNEPSTAPSSFATDQNIFSRVGSIDRGSNASLSLLSSAFDESERESKNRALYGMHERGECALAGSNRASFDQAMFTGEVELDNDFGPAQYAGARMSDVETAREYGQQRHLSLDGSIVDAAGFTHQRLKRKASPSDTSADEPVPQAARSRTPGRSAKRASPAHHSNLSQASFSSISNASARNASYPSTNIPLAPSSVTSTASQDQFSSGSNPAETGDKHHAHQHQHQHPPFGHQLQSEASASGNRLGHGSLSHMTARAQASAALQQEMAATRIGSESGTASAKSPLANIHMCNCCPKKPKKFPTLEALHAHQNEKQYYCNYCHNRFKNKNEAERHQNSLHLRKQSWSCAALDDHYQKAFHACTAVPTINCVQNPAPAPSPTTAECDVCGYCGKQFPNSPAPDWTERTKHLTEVHKFGECNQGKKFFRADHFRQHLKHSHGGVAGKWTNMLEAACLRDEPLPQPIDSPAKEQSRQQEQQQQQQQQQQQHNKVQAVQALQAVQQQSASQASTAAYQVEGRRSNVSPKLSPSLGPGLGQSQHGFPVYSSHAQYERLNEREHAAHH